MGNFLYWTVYVQNESSRQYYALGTDSLQKVRDFSIPGAINKWDKVAGKLFPFYLDFQKSTSEYIFPQLHFTSFLAFIPNILLALLFAFIYPKRPVKIKIFTCVFALIFGIVGALALLLQWRTED